MKKNYSLITIAFIITIICAFLVSCPLLWPKPDQERWIAGRELLGYPEWLTPHKDSIYAFGVSECIDWQSEKGKQFHTLVPDDVIDGGYVGKFRVLLIGQYTSILFNDKERTSYALFYNWVHEVNSTTTGHYFTQSDSEKKFEYTCHAKTNLRENETDSNKANVLITRLSTSGELPNRFNYKLTIAGGTVIDIDLKNRFETKTVVPTLIQYSWMPKRVGQFFYDTDSNEFKLEGAMIIIQKDTSNIRKGGLFCFEGISFKDVDDTNKTISFWLEDRTQSDFADYVTLKVHDDLEYADISYHKEGQSEPVCMDMNVKCVYE